MNTYIQIGLIIYDAILAVYFLLKFNGYSFKEKKEIRILFVLLCIISFLNSNFNIITILLCVIISHISMQLLHFKRITPLRCLCSCLLFYGTLMINNTISFGMLQLLKRQKFYYIMENNLADYWMMSFLSKINLFILCNIYIYMKIYFEKGGHNENIYGYLFILIYNILLISTMMYLYTERMIGFGFVREIGMIIVIVLAGIFFSEIVLFYMYVKLSDKSELEIENRTLKYRSEYDKEFYEKSMFQFESANKMNHDMRNHLMNIAHQIQEKQYNQAIQYIQKLSEYTNYTSFPIKIDHPILNFIINSKLITAKEKGVQVEGNIQNIKDMVLEDFEVCSMLGNLLDNAIEASVKEKERHIIVELYLHNGYQVFLVRNKILKSILQYNAELKSHKKNKLHHGYGMKQIYQIANKYDGHVDVFEKDRYFYVKVFIPYNT